VGFWKDEAEIEALWERERVFEPAIAREASAARLGEWQRALERSRGWARES
jgi:glycerol kinase